MTYLQPAHPYIDENLLSGDVWRKLSAISGELEDNHGKRQIFRTETEARVSVLDRVRLPTPAMRYWQCVREQAAMLDNLVNLSFEFRRNAVEQERLVHEMIQLNRRPHCRFEKDALTIDIEQAEYKAANMRQHAEDRARELLMWSKIKAELDDGSFNTQDPDEHQLLSYLAQFSLRADKLERGAPQIEQGDFLNLAGLLQTTIDRCRELGIMDKAIAVMPPAVAAAVSSIEAKA